MKIYPLIIALLTSKWVRGATDKDDLVKASPKLLIMRMLDDHLLHNNENKNENPTDHQARSADQIIFENNSNNRFTNFKNVQISGIFPTETNIEPYDNKPHNGLVFGDGSNYVFGPKHQVGNVENDFKDTTSSFEHNKKSDNRDERRHNKYNLNNNNISQLPFNDDQIETIPYFKENRNEDKFTFDHIKSKQVDFKATGNEYSEQVFGKRVVFEDNDKEISEEVYKTKNGRPGFTFATENLPVDKQYYSNGYSNPYQVNNGYPPHDYLIGNSQSSGATNLAFPVQNDFDMQTNTKYTGQKYPSLGRPGLYSGQGGAGYSYSGHYGEKGHPGPGYGYVNVHQGYHRPTPQPINLAQRAVSAVTEALTSIALYDDKQCVPRLLCEASSGSTASSPTLLKATAALGPLLTILQTYNGISSSPLFLFGRAAVLGVTSKGNPTTCRYAYPQCPTEPDKLINYLNNHNGGFFRFFGQPQKQQQQNLEQFYNQLSGYGHLQQQAYQQPNRGQSYHSQHPYPFYNEQISQKSSAIDNEIAASDIEERIQNKPMINNLEDDTNDEASKWTFPDELSYENDVDIYNVGRKGIAKKINTNYANKVNILKFPQETEFGEDNLYSSENRDIVRKQKRIFFPDGNSFYVQPDYQSTTPVNLDEYVFDYKHNFYVQRPKYTNYNDNNDNIQLLYVVRGNSDPNHPEIIKVRPGQRP